VQTLDLADRRILGPDDAGTSADELFASLSRRMQRFGRAPEAPYGGSRVKTIRLQIDSGRSPPSADMPLLLGLEPVGSTVGPGAIEVWSAVEEATHSPPGMGSGKARSHDLLGEGGVRLNPDAVLEAAAARAKTAVPNDPGEGRALLEACGFELVPHGAPPSSSPFLSPDDRSWAEGRPKFVAHLKRERSPGLSKAKKAQFREQHGQLHCERCGLQPVETFGAAGEACIEVHHRLVSVGEMAEDHRTRLADVECLCANCHRIVHAEMSRAARLGAVT
jgi:5-methylcytosine-specific restriction protein A